jgi:Domain of unknown function (DUF4010)
VNSRKVIVEFILCAEGNREALLPLVYRGVMLATAAMALRNAIIVAVLAKSKNALFYSAAPLGLMFVLSLALWITHPQRRDSGTAAPLQLDSPFSLSAALKFGAVFLLLNGRRTGATAFWLGELLLCQHGRWATLQRLVDCFCFDFDQPRRSPGANWGDWCRALKLDERAGQYSVAATHSSRWWIPPQGNSRPRLCLPRWNRRYRNGSGVVSYAPELASDLEVESLENEVLTERRVDSITVTFTDTGGANALLDMKQMSGRSMALSSNAASAPSMIQ